MEKLTAKGRRGARILLEPRGNVCERYSRFYDEPRPHFNTISTIVRSLEEKGYVGHTQHGKTYRYYAVVAEEEMGKKTIGTVVSRYFRNSYLRVVSSFVEDGNIPVEDLRRLLDEVEAANRNKTD